MKPLSSNQKEYIGQQLRHGWDPTVIIRELIHKGHDKNDVVKAVHAAQDRQMEFDKARIKAQLRAGHKPFDIAKDLASRSGSMDKAMRVVAVALREVHQV